MATVLYLLCISMIIVNVSTRNTFVMDERGLCQAKRSCLECLKLSHCSWCDTESKCFSKKLKMFESFCPNNTVDHRDYGLSIKENSECSCGHGEIKRRCYPPGVTDGVECSGRGECLCGRCLCNTEPDLDHPTKLSTKMVMGEFCELDNFSCDGPDCNEGPYLLSQPVQVDL